VAVASAGSYASLTSLQTDNHASTPALSFLQAGCPSCRPTNSVKALKAFMLSFNYCKIKKLPLLTSSELESFNYILHQKLKKNQVTDIRQKQQAKNIYAQINANTFH